MWYSFVCYFLVFMVTFSSYFQQKQTKKVTLLCLRILKWSQEMWNVLCLSFHLMVMEETRPHMLCWVLDHLHLHLFEGMPRTEFMWSKLMQTSNRKLDPAYSFLKDKMTLFDFCPSHLKPMFSLKEREKIIWPNYSQYSLCIVHSKRLEKNKVAEENKDREAETDQITRAVVLMRERVPSVLRLTRQLTNPVQGRQHSEQIISSAPHTLSLVPIECDERGAG